MSDSTDFLIASVAKMLDHGQITSAIMNCELYLLHKLTKEQRYTILLILGLAYQRKSNFQKSCEYLLQALELKPEDNDASKILIHSYYHGGEVDKAFELLDDFISKHPDNAEAWNYKGTLFCDQKNYKKSLRYLLKAFEIEPHNQNYWYNIGNTYVDGYLDLERGIHWFRKILKHQPDHANSWFKLGLAYQKLQQYEKALEHYHKSLECKPSLIMSYNNISCIYKQLGEYTKALEYINKALEINPDFWFGKQNKMDLEMIISGELKPIGEMMLYF